MLGMMNQITVCTYLLLEILAFCFELSMLHAFLGLTFVCVRVNTLIVPTMPNESSKLSLIPA